MDDLPAAGSELVRDVDVMDDGSWEIMRPVFSDSCVKTGFLTSISNRRGVQQVKQVGVIVDANISPVWPVFGKLGYVARFTYVDVHTLFRYFPLSRATAITSMATTTKAVVDFYSGPLPAVLKLTTTFTHRCRHMVPDP